MISFWKSEYLEREKDKDKISNNWRFFKRWLKIRCLWSNVSLLFLGIYCPLYTVLCSNAANSKGRLVICLHNELIVCMRCAGATKTSRVSPARRLIKYSYCITCFQLKVRIICLQSSIQNQACLITSMPITQTAVMIWYFLLNKSFFQNFKNLDVYYSATLRSMST